MSLRENQAKQIAEWVVERVDREDFDELAERLPEEMRKAYIKRNTLKQQPVSIWRHYRNWVIHVKGEWDPLAIFAFIIWAAIVGLSMISWSSPDVLRDKVITAVVSSTLILQIIPRTITFIRWRCWYARHPISLHGYWRVEDYLN